MWPKRRDGGIKKLNGDIMRGRPRKVTEDQLSAIQQLVKSNVHPYKISKILGINKGSVYYFVKKEALLNNVKFTEQVINQPNSKV
jgi:hypothetical protein